MEYTCVGQKSLQNETVKRQIHALHLEFCDFCLYERVNSMQICLKKKGKKNAGMTWVRLTCLMLLSDGKVC